MKNPMIELLLKCLDREEAYIGEHAEVIAEIKKTQEEYYA